MRSIILPVISGFFQGFWILRIPGRANTNLYCCSQDIAACFAGLATNIQKLWVFSKCRSIE
jgi:hypothetical protein